MIDNHKKLSNVIIVRMPFRKQTSEESKQEEIKQIILKDIFSIWYYLVFFWSTRFQFYHY